MIVKIYNYETRQLINEVNVKGKFSSPFDVLRELRRKQINEDVLMVGELGIVDFGVSTFSTNGLQSNSLTNKNSNAIYNSNNSCIIGKNEVVETYTPKNVTLNNKTLDLKVFFVMYEQGFVLNTGLKGCNIFGQKLNRYISSIGSRNIHTKSITGARVFKDMKVLKKFIEKHKTTLEFCVKEYGYELTIETTCSLMDEYLANLNEKEKIRYETSKKEVDELLEIINESDKDDDSDGYDDKGLESIVSPLTDETIFNEILYRMKKLDLWEQIVAKYKKNGAIYMSDASVIFELDETAKQVVAYAKEEGLVPYHVVVSHYSELGTMYSILFVSQNISNWKYERGNKQGWIYTLCYNVPSDDYEYGESQFIGGTGGLTRIG